MGVVVNHDSSTKTVRLVKLHNSVTLKWNVNCLMITFELVENDVNINLQK